MVCLGTTRSFCAQFHQKICLAFLVTCMSSFICTVIKYWKGAQDMWFKIVLLFMLLFDSIVHKHQHLQLHLLHYIQYTHRKKSAHPTLFSKPLLRQTNNFFLPKIWSFHRQSEIRGLSFLNSSDCHLQSKFSWCIQLVRVSNYESCYKVCGVYWMCWKSLCVPMQCMRNATQSNATAVVICWLQTK